MIVNISDKDDLKNMAQAILQTRAAARSVESFVASMRPLVNDTIWKTRLDHVATLSHDTANVLQDLYEQIAPEAFK
jgi:hypothetical protein